MAKTKLVIVFILAIGLSACNMQDTSNITNYYIAAEVIITTKPLYESPYTMLYDQSDSTLLMNITQGKYSLKRVDPKNGNVTEFLGVGKGRGEYIQFRLNDIDQSGNMYARDYPMIINITNEGGLISKHNPIEKGLNVLKFKQFKEGYIAHGNFKSPKQILTLLDNEWQVIANFGEFPYDGISEAEGGINAKIMAYQARAILTSEQRSKVAFVSSSGEFFTIYYIDEKYNIDEIYRIENNLPIYVKTQGLGYSVTHQNKTFYYVDATCTDNNIYILYSGKNIEAKSNAGVLNASSSNMILVYDWDGEHIYNLKTNLNLLNICVSSDGKELYAISVSEDYEFNLCRFDISELGDI